MAAGLTEDRGDSLSVAWTDIVRFVRQLSHDLRNHLNAAELQAAYISELVADAELKDEIKRLRATISGLGATLQKLSVDLGSMKPSVMPYRALDFVEDIQKKVAHDFPEKRAAIKWDIALQDAILTIDPQLLQHALIELFVNAFQHSPGNGGIQAKAEIETGHFVFTLREPKGPLDLSKEDWGREPLRKIRQGHYGLGLNRVRVIVEEHKGQLRAHYNPVESVLLTTITLPLSAEPG
jgi:K+-sensing histidine kinase KdpD